MSNVTNRLDAKGRVSIPAPFRSVLARDGFPGLFLQPSLDQPAWDAGGNALLAEIDGAIARLSACSAERDGLALALFGMSEILKPDPEGRIVLTDTVRAHAGITEAVTFVGLGSKFQLWEPERFAARLREARAGARKPTAVSRPVDPASA